MTFITDMLTGANKREAEATRAPNNRDTGPLISGKHNPEASAPAPAAPTRKAPEGARLPTDHPDRQRPGSLPPKDYIGSTRIALNKTRDTYQAELALLDSDIAKLTEDRRQLKIAVAGIDAALAAITEGDIVPPGRVVRSHEDMRHVMDTVKRPDTSVVAEEQRKADDALKLDEEALERDLRLIDEHGGQV